jgi:hypothetical protein
LESGDCECAWFGARDGCSDCGCARVAGKAHIDGGATVVTSPNDRTSQSVPSLGVSSCRSLASSGSGGARSPEGPVASLLPTSELEVLAVQRD